MSNILNFEVTANRLELKDGFSPVNTEHNYTIIRVSFEQGSDWANCALITAGFFVSADQIYTIQPAATSGLTCSFTIPGEVLASGVDEFHFGLTGSYTENGSTVTVATNIVTINARRGVLIGEAVDLSAYEKLLAAINAGLALKEDKANKKTSINSNNQDSNNYYPSINAVVQYLLAHFYTKAQLDTTWWDTAVIPFFTDKFITPEMYGAVGDGDTDDTEAIQYAVDNADGKVVLMIGNYATTSTIVIDGQTDVYHVGSINYSGAGSAVKIQNVTTHCNLKFDKIEALNGNGIEFYASAKDETRNKLKTYVQYVKLEFDIIKAADKCIWLNLDAASRLTQGSGIQDNQVGWINEIVIYGGRLAQGKFGIHGDAQGYQKMNGIKIYNVSLEGIGNYVIDPEDQNAVPEVGIYMANGCKRWSFTNLRYMELKDGHYLMQTEEKAVYDTYDQPIIAAAEEFMFYGHEWIGNRFWDLSAHTTGIINIPTHGELPEGISGMTRIVKEAPPEQPEPKHAVIDQTLNTQFKAALDTINPALNAAKSVTDRFVFKSITYNSSNKKSLKEHGIVPAKAGFYFISLTTNTNGDHSSVYIVRVWNVAGQGEDPIYDVDVAIPIYAGTGSQAPRITVAVGENDDPKIYGLLSKNTSNSTTNIQTMAIKVANL